jgi:hypothetical protein
MNDVLEVVEIGALVLIVLYLFSQAKKNKGGCGCSDKAVDEVTVGKGPCA